MSVARVNLLPPEIGQRSARRRVIAVGSGLLALYAVLLLALYLVKSSEVAQATRDRDAAQAELALLQAEEAELAPLRELDTELDDRNAVLVSALSLEVSGARILNELSLAFPANSSLRALNLAVSPPVPVAAPVAPAAPAEGAAAPAAEGAAAPAAEGAAAPVTPEVAAPAVPLIVDPALAAQTVIGAVTYEGYSVDQYAPGVETLLEDLDEVPGLADPFALSAQAELIGETEVTGFGGQADLTAEAYTRRYERGLTLETSP